MISNKQKHRSKDYFQKKWQYFRLISSHRKRQKTISKDEKPTDTKYSTSEISSRKLPVSRAEQYIAAGTIVLAIATVFLAIYTYRLFNEAVSEGTANDIRFSADTTALNAQIRNSEKTYELNKRSTDSSIAISKATLQQQINAFKETQNEFQIENKPIISIGDITVDSPKSDQHIRIHIKIENFGRQPAKIVDSEIKVVETQETDFRDYSQLNKTVLNIYLAGQTFVPLTARTDDNIPGDMIDRIYEGTNFIYLIGKVNYINTVTNEKKVYTFNYRISYYPFFNIVILNG